MKAKDIGYFILCLVIPLAVGGLSGYITREAITDWYDTLAKPSFNPPNSVFGPVWTALYILMGISLFMIVREPGGNRRSNALLIFGVQLFLNFWWSIFFFHFKRLDISLAEICMLWGSILWMIIVFRRLKPAAAWLQVPYLCWVTFASVLNYSIWQLNY